MNIVAHNIVAMNAQRQLNINTSDKSKNTEKLSSGYKINRAADDAAGLSISEKLRWQVRGLNRAAQNIQDGTSLVQVTDGALNEAESILQRMRELSVQAANDTNTDTDRNAIQQEINQGITELNRIAETTTFNGIFPLRAQDQYALDPTISENTTPTQVEQGVYNMDSTLYVDTDGTGDLKPVEGVSIDFASTVPADLDQKNFYVTCSAACNQVFSFSFDNSIGSGSSTIRTVTQDGRDNLYLTIGTSNMTTGASIPTTIANLLDSIGAETSNSNYEIGHANSLNIKGSSMIFYATSGSANTSHSNSTLHDENGNDLKSGFYYGSVYLTGMEEQISMETQASKWGLKVQAGSLSDQAIDVPLMWMEARKMGIDPLNVSTHDSASFAITAVDNAIGWLNDKRSELGAIQNRLEHAYDLNTNTSENTDSAESRIRDTDMAKTMVDFSRSSILEQMGQSMMAQANSFNESVLSLLQ